MQLLNRDAIQDQDPRPHLWTRAEYEQMGDLGLFQDRRIQLIEGQVVEMSPMKSSHASAVDLVAEALQHACGGAFYVRQQKPLALTDRSEPEPDVAVIAGSIRDYVEAHPTTALLVIEVSDSTLAFDQQVKTRLYAQSQLQEYWILNLVDRCLEVYRLPQQDPNDPSQWIYVEQCVYHVQDRVEPLILPQRQICVADLLP